MRVVEIAVFQVRVPLKKEIRHASYVRNHSDNIVVSAKLENGVEGFGEGVPRTYVTGENVEEAARCIRQSDLSGQLAPIKSLPDAAAMLAEFKLWKPRADQRGCLGNSALCGLELAILDAYARHFGEPVGNLIWQLPEFKEIANEHPRVRYSGAITAGSPKQEFWSAVKMKIYGFRDCKVKVGVEGQDDLQRMQKIRRILGKRVRIRIDANEAWQPDNTSEKIRQLIPFDIASVEQPVLHEHVDCLRVVREETNVPIMHDESLCCMNDARAAVENQTCDLFNIRLSKCGGLLNSLRIACFAQQNGIGIQLGCQVGETGLLSAAGRQFASNVGPIRFLEGSYDRHLVHERLTAEDLTFRYGGRAPRLTGPGLGVTVDKAALKRITTREESITIG